MIAITLLALAAISLGGRLTRAAGKGQGGCRRMPGGRDSATIGARAVWVWKAFMGSLRSGLMGQPSYWTTVFMHSIINTMDNSPPAQWVIQCAERLHERWQTVEPAQLEEVAMELWHDARLRSLPPAKAASLWLSPLAGQQA